MEAGLGTYPQREDELNDELASAFSRQPDRSITPEAVVLPHGSFNKIVSTAAATVNAIDTDNIRSIVLLSSTDMETQACYTSEGFETPLGTVPVDSGFLTQLQLSTPFEEYKKPFQRTSRYHGPLIFFKHVIDNIEIVPLHVANDISFDTMEQLVEGIRQTMHPNDLLVASSTLASYTNTDKDPREVVHQRDSKTISMLRDSDYNKIREDGQELGLDGRQAFATCCALIGRRELAIIDHRIRYDDPSIQETARGYAGLIYT